MNMQIQPIIRGDSDRKHPAVCRIDLTSNFGLEYTCTGTLIAPDLVLCAAHCVDAPRIHSAVCIFDDREVPAVRWFWSKDFSQPAIESGSTEHIRLLSVGKDFTILQLLTPAFNINPMPMMRLRVLKDLCRQGKIRELTAVGFGRFSRHELANIAAGVQKRTASFIKFAFPPNTETIIIKPTVRRENEPVSIAVGDSGGPYIARVRGVDYLAATVSTVTYDSQGDASFATALSVDAPIEFFESTIFQNFTQSLGPLGFGYVRPQKIEIDRANADKIVIDENACIHGYCLQEKPILFGGLAVGVVATMVSVALNIRNADKTEGK